MAAVGGMQRLVHGGGTRRQLHNDSRSCSTLVPAATAHPLPRLTLMPWSLPFSSRYLNCFRPSITPHASRMVCAGGFGGAWRGREVGIDCLGHKCTGRPHPCHWCAAEACAARSLMHSAPAPRAGWSSSAGAPSAAAPVQRHECEKRPRLGTDQQCVQQCTVNQCGTIRQRTCASLTRPSAQPPPQLPHNHLAAPTL